MRTVELRPDSLPGLTSDLLAGFQARWWRSADETLRREVVKPPPGRVSGKLAAPYLQACRDVVEHALRREARRCSPAEWLFYLRRTPDALWMDTGDVAINLHRRHIAEVASALAKEAGPDWVKAVPGFPLDRHATERVISLAAGAYLYASIEWLLRECSRGADFEFVQAAELPRAVPTPEQATATRSCLERLAAVGGGGGLRSGTRLLSMRAHTLESAELLACTATARRWHFDGWRGEDGEFSVRVLSQVIPEAWSIQPPLDACSQPTSFVPAQTVEAIGRLYLLLTLCSILVRQFPAWNSMLLYGYVSWDFDALIEEADNWMPRIVNHMPKELVTATLPKTGLELVVWARGTAKPASAEAGTIPEGGRQSGSC